MRIKNTDGEIIKAGCVVTQDNKVILVTNKDKSAWAFPKGHAEPGENIEQTALRETLEETGYQVEVIKRLKDVTYIDNETNELVRVAMFWAKPISKIDEGEGIAKWVDSTKARKLIWENGIPLLDEIGLS